MEGLFFKSCILSHGRCVEFIGWTIRVLVLDWYNLWAVSKESPTLTKEVLLTDHVFFIFDVKVEIEEALRLLLNKISKGNTCVGE
jgi:hypothetical protein